MNYLNSLLQHHMPAKQRVGVNSTPRISQIYDAINSTLAVKDSQIKLPPEFYDMTARRVINMIAYDEEFGPFHENEEYRTLGIGALLGDIVERMTQKVEANSLNPGMRFAIYGGHDSTLIGILASLGILEDNSRIWPPYSSNVAIELFQLKEAESNSQKPVRSISSITATSIGRTQTTELSSLQKQNMNGYYVRIRYNDQPMIIPGCRPTTKHLNGDRFFCTLVSDFHLYA